MLKELDKKQAVAKGLLLPVMEAYYTIQGEGEHAGMPAYFIRLAGCDVGCHWCDVKESWEAGEHQFQEIDRLLEPLNDYPVKNVVITGGEPLMYNLNPLTEKLQQKGYQTWLETSGAYPLSGNWHWICLSPKKMATPVENIHQLTHELKVVVYNRHDLRWAEQHAEKVSDSCKLYLQPEWSKRNKILPAIVQYVKEHPEWNISLQTHKYIDIP